MDANQFDHIVRAIGNRPSRRRVTGLLAGSAFGGLMAQRAPRVDAKKKRKKKKCNAPRVKCGKACCQAGQSCLDGRCDTPPPPLGTTTTTSTTTQPPAPPPPGPNPSCQGTPNSSFLVGGAAQTFIAERTGQLVAAECLVTNLDGGEDFVLEIRALDETGAPGEEILATDTVLNVPPVDPADTLTLTGVFDPPADVETGVGYALVVSVNTGTFVIRARSGNACPAQKFFLDPSGNGSFAESSNNDMVFTATILV